MRRFHLVRKVDASGISGTGRVAEGVLFDNGWVAMIWLSARPSVNLFASIEDVEAIHGHDHKTEIVFVDEPVLTEKHSSSRTRHEKRKPLN